MLLTELVEAKVIVVNPLQLLKAYFPMDVTELGIVMEVKLLQFSNALLAMVLTV